MSGNLTFGLVFGIIAIGAGLYFILNALGYGQYLGGKRRSSIPAVNKEALIGRLLHLNDLAKPYSIVEGKDTDLVAEWKIVDAAWYGIFSKSHFSQAYRASLLVDKARHTVRCFEEIGRVGWVQDTSGLRPVVNYRQKGWFRGLFKGGLPVREEIGKAYAVKSPEGLEAGKVYDYKFDIDDIRQPIISAIIESGWEWVPVTVRKHATYKSSGSLNK